jgi:dTDP-4-dehydrorhamnose reductase
VKPSRVLIVGAAGQLGSAMVRVFAGADVVAHTRATLDITDGAAVAHAIACAAPQVIVNCAAFNDVDGAESAPLDALSVNALAVRSLARAAAAVDATFVHFSSDFVFDGTAEEPYDERVPPSPRSTYAASKLLGEWFAPDAPRALVLRVASLFGSRRDWSGRRGTVDAIVAGLEQGREVRVFADRVVSPSYTSDVAAATRYLVETDAAPGLYHCVNAGWGTWYEVAAEAARLLGVTPQLVPVTMAQAQMQASRPRFCALSNRKLAATGFRMPTWSDALRRWLEARALPAA